MSTETAAARQPARTAKQEPEPEDVYGRKARVPSQIPLIGWIQIAHRVWHESGRDNLSVVSAGCAFYALFAIFPALSGLISLYGLMASPATVEQHFSILDALLPEQAYQMVEQQIHRLAATSSQSLGYSLALSLGLALWSTSLAAQAMFAALNIAYEEEERRSLLGYYFGASIFAVIGILGGLLMLLAIIYVPTWIDVLGFSEPFEQIVRIARWPFLAVITLLALALLYRYGPCRRPANWHWVSVGSAFATAFWLLASGGFSLYVANFAHYDRIYGSLGAVIILLFWLYLSFYIVLLGAEINAELELQTAEDTTIGRSRPMGQRGAFVADHVAGGPSGAKRPYNPHAGQMR
ncbi:MAG: YihY/virulence factor BrkB family protein [Methyloligella sp. ZOD6]